MITVYTSTNCASCITVKRFLASKGKAFKVVNLDENPDLRQLLVEKTGFMSVPITQIDDQYIVGWSPSKFAAIV